MIDSNTIETLTKALSDRLPAELTAIKEEVENNFKSILQQQFAKLDLVTREEFDAQNAVLIRTRVKLEALEKTLADLTNCKN
ncbi:MAG: accessory factor UbiK family protein [Cycloclasticus sp.]